MLGFYDKQDANVVSCLDVFTWYKNLIYTFERKVTGEIRYGKL